MVLYTASREEQGCLSGGWVCRPAVPELSAVGRNKFAQLWEQLGLAPTSGLLSALPNGCVAPALGQTGHAQIHVGHRVAGRCHVW
jgi:hypothetical protein